MAKAPQIPDKFEFKVQIKTPKLDLSGRTDKAKAAMKKALTRGIQQGGAAIESSLKQALDRAMESPSWGWTGTVTKRRNGSETGSPRDIVDTGRLQASGKVVASYLVTKTKFEVRYTAPYAQLVHQGGYIQPYGRRDRDTVYLPARPWIRSVMLGENGFEKFDVDGIMNEAISKAWKEQFG